MQLKSRDQIIADRVLYGFLAVVALGIVTPIIIALWYVTIPIGLAALWLWWKKASEKYEASKQLEAIVKLKNRRYKGEACTLDGRYGIVEEIGIQSSGESRTLYADCTVIATGEQTHRIEKGHAVLIPIPKRLGTLSSDKSFTELLRSHNLELLSDLSVESKAVKALLEHCEQGAWMTEAILNMDKTTRDIENTLRTAQRNELLKPSIPGLENARSALNEELQKIKDAQSASASQLKSLIEFLAVPKNIRAALNYELENPRGGVDIKSLKESYEEVVALNEAYVGLCRNSSLGT